MSTLHLHIGSGKTGTTSIQEVFHANRKQLKEHGFVYPGPNPDHHLLFFASDAPPKDWARTYKGLEQQKLQAVLNNYFSKLRQDLKSDDDQIISTEYLFFSNPEYVQNIASFLKDYFDQIIVYVFVREPVSFYRSHQQQILKARSYISSPFEYKYDFKGTIEAWAKYFEVKLIKYEKGQNSCKTLCDLIGIDFDVLQQKDKRTKKSVSIEQMALLEKIQRHYYTQIDDQLNGKIHLKTLVHITAPFTHKAKLKDWVKSTIYSNHQEDLHWLKEKSGIDFLSDYPAVDEFSDLPTFENGKATVRDIYEVEDEQSVEKYEALVVDALLKKLVQGNRN